MTLSHWFDRTFLPLEYQRDGSSDYRSSFVCEYIPKYGKVYDIGGGKHPCLSLKFKKQQMLHVIGLDIDSHELEQAPPGLYDEVLESDITTYSGKGDADVVVCHTLLEHVTSVEAAFQGIETILKPGGKALIFVPSRNAMFARLNLVLPEAFKKRVLYTIFPQTLKHQGFKSYYDHCTPRDFERIAEKCGLRLKEKRLYFLSAYFSFFFPLYVGWRCWLLVFRYFAGEQAAESFSMVFQKPT